MEFDQAPGQSGQTYMDTKPFIDPNTVSNQTPAIIDPNFQPQVRVRSNTWPLRPKPEPGEENEAQPPPAVAEEVVDSTSRDTLAELSASKKSNSRRNAWGNLSYADLITQAINSSPEGRLTLSQIYDWMVQNIPYFKDKGESNSSAGWKNSIRHNLSLHNRFMRTQNEGAGKSSWWVINPDAKAGKSPRRRAYSMDTKDKNMEKKRGRAKKKVEAMRAALEAGGSPTSTIAETSEPGYEPLPSFLPSEFRARTSSNASSCGRISPIRHQLLQDFDDTNNMSPISWNTGSTSSLNALYRDNGFNDMNNISEMMTLTLADSALGEAGLEESLLTQTEISSSPNTSLNTTSSPFPSNGQSFQQTPFPQQQQQFHCPQLPPPPPYPTSTDQQQQHQRCSPQHSGASPQQQQQPLMLNTQVINDSTMRCRSAGASPNHQVSLSGGHMHQLASSLSNQLITDSDLDLDMNPINRGSSDDLMLSQQYADSTGDLPTHFTTPIQENQLRANLSSAFDSHQSILRAALTKPHTPFLSAVPNIGSQMSSQNYLSDFNDLGTMEDFSDLQGLDCDVNEVIKHELNVDGCLDCNFDSIGTQSANGFVR